MRKLILIAKVRPSARAEFAQETHLIGGGPPRGATKPCFSLSENTRRRMILYQRDQVVHCSRPLSPFPSPFSLLLSYHSLSLSLFLILSSSLPISLFHSHPLSLSAMRYLSGNFARSIGRAFPCIFTTMYYIYENTSHARAHANDEQR